MSTLTQKTKVMNSCRRAEQSRRSKAPDWHVRLAGCSSYKTARGYWQADSNLDYCYAMAKSEGTYLVRHGMKPEQYLNGDDWAEPFDYLVELD